MNDIADLRPDGLPSSRALLRATAIAALIAGVVLMLFVLPAEYGLDPTGIGARLGLTPMSEFPEIDPSEIPVPSEEVPAALDMPSAPGAVLDPVWKSDRPFREDEMSLTLKPNEGAEIKALMKVGERMMFTWVADGGVNFDMHGETLDASEDDYTSYWKGRDATTGHGAFQAPFAGTHGWFWRNRGTVPVTVCVKTSGYYAKLFKP